MNTAMNRSIRTISLGSWIFGISLLANNASAQTTMFTIPNNSSVAALGDVTGDGIPEIIVGSSPTRIVSMYDNQTVATLIDPTPTVTSSFGSAVTKIPDVTGDGLPDVAVGEFGEFGSSGGQGVVHVFSSQGTHLYTAQGTPNASRFGKSLVGLDGLPGGFIAGSDQETVYGYPACPSCTRYYAGTAYRFSTTGSLLQQIIAPLPGNNLNFGSSVANAGDTDGDGVTDFLIGEPNLPALNRYGNVYLFSGASGLHIRTHSEVTGASRFGEVAGNIGDINGDGRSEYMVGGAAFGSTGTPEIHVVDGQSGTYLYSFLSPPAPSTALSFGSSGSGIGDIDGDSVLDFAIGDTQRSLFFSGATGGLIQTISGQALQHVSLGDINHDGTPDILIKDATGARVISPITLPAANYAVVGASCSGLGVGQSLNPTALTTFARIGGSLSFQVPARSGIILTLLVISTGTPINAPIGGGCTVYANPGTIVFSQTLGSISSSSASLSVPLPTVPTAVGLPLTAQLVGIDAAGQLSFSNGISMSLGY